MRTILLLSCVAIAIIVAGASTSRGEGDIDVADDTTQPITGQPVLPFKGAETPMKDPFAPYDTGAQEPGDVWNYEDLSATDKAIADRGLDEDQSGVQDAYAAAARGLAHRAKAEGAAAQLGLDTPLAELGVVTDEETVAP